MMPQLCAALALLSMATWSHSAAAQQPIQNITRHSAIYGIVLDPSGKPADGAIVQLEVKGAPAAEARTNADGAFTLSSPGIGTYALRARKSGLAARIDLVVKTGGEQPPVELRLVSAEKPVVSNPSGSNSAMEFSDAPNFTVAAVTDWTAAGGHGSDSSLRTSEALTRETLTLKPHGANDRMATTPAAKSAEQHRIAGERYEKMGDPLAAVHEFEQAVHDDPSEQNFFAWGSELLLHRAVLQAKDVFGTGSRLYPISARLLTALGAALFAGAFYDDAAMRLCEASDLNPADPEPYIFMGKIETAAPNPLACVEPRLARFVEKYPENPLANFYYAMTISKQKGPSIDRSELEHVEALLTKATTVDSKCSEAYLQLGVLHSSQHDYEKAISFYNKAIESNPQMSEAHYRLGVAYDRAGDREKAKQEFQLHAQIDKQQKAEVERRRKEVKQFLVVVPEKPSEPSVP